MDDGDGLVYRRWRRGEAGESRSARVSVCQDVAGTAEANAIAIERPEDEPIVVTILLYNTIRSTSDAEVTNVAPLDVAAAVTDMEHIYGLAKDEGGHVCRLSELSAMLHKLTVEDVETCSMKRKLDPASDPMVPNRRRSPRLPNRGHVEARGSPTACIG